MDLGLANTYAVVTGGTSGIGLAAARILIEEGARVAICGRDADRLAAAKAQLDAVKPGAVLAERCNVLDSGDVNAFADKVKAWSGGKLDLLVNNAGQGRVSKFADTTDAQWREELDLKFFSQILPLRAFKPLLDAAPAPAIVAVNSLLSLQPEPHMVCTSAARAGVQNLLKSLATEFAPRIRVNTILLGLVDSGQWQRRFEARADKSLSREEWFGALARDKHIPLQRLGAPDEPARAIVFLGSPAASYITGASLEVSGGVSRFI
ncbi:MAG TPA: SDR family oxidoreductase [Pseudolabrys sp.]|nr:SDR family oxidoreductase [Pseudolabrys sp.]